MTPEEIKKYCPEDFETYEFLEGLRGASSVHYGAWQEKFVVLVIQKARAKKSLEASNKVLERYENWEGNLILSDEAWKGMKAFPELTEELHNDLMEIQALRNEALGR